MKQDKNKTDLLEDFINVPELLNMFLNLNDLYFEYSIITCVLFLCTYIHLTF